MVFDVKLWAQCTDLENPKTNKQTNKKQTKQNNNTNPTNEKVNLTMVGFCGELVGAMHRFRKPQNKQTNKTNKIRRTKG